MTEIKLPTAKEMAERTNKATDMIVEEVLLTIQEKLNKAQNSKIAISISEKHEKVINIVTTKLKELGYNVNYKCGYFEDRPCGGWVSGLLEMSW